MTKSVLPASFVTPQRATAPVSVRALKLVDKIATVLPVRLVTGSKELVSPNLLPHAMQTLIAKQPGIAALQPKDVKSALRVFASKTVTVKKVRRVLAGVV